MTDDIHHITLNMDKVKWEKISELAKEDKRSINSQMVFMLDDYIKELEKEEWSFEAGLAQYQEHLKEMDEKGTHEVSLKHNKFHTINSNVLSAISEETLRSLVFDLAKEISKDTIKATLVVYKSEMLTALKNATAK